MAQEESSFDFGTFKVHVKYLGEYGGYAYETRIEVPGYDPMYDTIRLPRYPIAASAAAGAIDQVRNLLKIGVPAYLENWRKEKGSMSFKEVQNMRLTFLSWQDAALEIGGEEVLAAAVKQLEAQELEERRTVYKEQEQPEEGEIPVDVQYDLGSVVMDMRVMGIIEGYPLWHVMAMVPGTDLHAESLIGAISPFALPVAGLMADNLEAVLRLGVERYLKEDPRAKRTPVPPEKRRGAESLYAVASHIGPEGVAHAVKVVNDAIQEKLNTLEGEALAAMEATIAEYRQRKPKI